MHMAWMLAHGTLRLGICSIVSFVYLGHMVSQVVSRHACTHGMHMQVPRLLLTPTRAKVLPPEPETSNRVLRAFRCAHLGVGSSIGGGSGARGNSGGCGCGLDAYSLVSAHVTFICARRVTVGVMAHM